MPLPGSSCETGLRIEAQEIHSDLGGVGDGVHAVGGQGARLGDDVGSPGDEVLRPEAPDQAFVAGARQRDDVQPLGVGQLGDVASHRSGRTGHEHRRPGREGEGVERVPGGQRKAAASEGVAFAGARTAETAGTTTASL